MALSPLNPMRKRPSDYNTLLLSVVVTCLLFPTYSTGLFECHINGDCQLEGAICENHSCVCPPDFVTDSIYTKCLPIAHGIGASCSDNLQCSASLKSGGFCNMNASQIRGEKPMSIKNSLDLGKCDCEPGYHYFLGNCWKTSGLGGKCFTNENCFVDQDFESSICSSNKICVCAEGYYQREYSSCRQASFNPGDPCGIPMDCKFKNATCSWNHTCTFNGSDSYSNVLSKFREVPNKNVYKKYALDLSRSAKPATHVTQLGKCSKTSDCPAHAECLSNGVCLCLAGFYMLDQSTCHPEVGANCTSDSDCTGRNTFCFNKTRCECTEGHVISTDRRYCDKLSRYLGWSCLRDAWCAYFGPNSICVNKKCACSNSTHYVPSEMYCWITKIAGESCQNELDCGMQGMLCTDGVCKCQKGTHPSSSGEECRPDSHAYGDKCTESLDCIFSNAACNVTTGKCICKHGFVLNGTTCVPGIGGPCNASNICFVKQSQCTNNTCACVNGYVSNQAGNGCLPNQTTFGGPCSESIQCKQLNAYCMEGKCNCTSDNHFVKGWKCFKNIQLGDSCTKNGECMAQHSSCLKNVCTCDHGYRSDGLLCSGGVSALFPLQATFLIIISFLIYL